ncbi:hypothetical protein [Streptomyces sp. SID10815]|uniref:hypothetical protein n=1 Tax=Streptomyces sp. SID10815 TaxID=2706027 RepID=UPI0013C65525|nr:hypothetical protein [Streptomyces sp. SID10815]NEA52392.1 hypothetical protein [Streptomyces sp. SID10815]
MAWDYQRNEPVTVENTQDELRKLSASAQRAENSGDALAATVYHEAINRELDGLDELKGK